MPMDTKRLKITTSRLEAETLNERLENAETAPPADTSWRYRKGGPPKVLALLGVVVGFVFLIVPGLLALRSYRRWQEGDGEEPTFAWSMAVVGGMALVVVPVFQVLPVMAVLLAVAIGVPLLAFVAPRR
jgi:hypothetical protein